jgi:hypothetical protein
MVKSRKKWTSSAVREEGGRRKTVGEEGGEGERQSVKRGGRE